MINNRFKIKAIYSGIEDTYLLVQTINSYTQRVSGYMFSRRYEFPSSPYATTKDRNLGTYPTIRQAMVVAATYVDFLRDTHITPKDKFSEFSHFEIDGNKVTDIAFLNFI